MFYVSVNCVVGLSDAWELSGGTSDDDGDLTVVVVDGASGLSIWIDLSDIREKNMSY